MVRARIGFLSFGLIICGCATISPSGDSLVNDVAAKAEEIARNVGGVDGFGGVLMDNYFNHMPFGIGFQSHGDLATSNGLVLIDLSNESSQDCTFQLSYVASYLGLTDRFEEVSVPAGQTIEVEIPCAEIIGMGQLDSPGTTGCLLADESVIPNTMAVPGFLNQDFACGGRFQFMLTVDVDDLDGDGDNEELVVLTEALQFHMMNGGPIGHGHGLGFGMMGGHGLFLTP